MYGSFNHSVDCSSSCKHVGFLQKNNSLDESGRILRSFKDGAAKNLLSCDNGEPRFRRSETDFSNLFARGRPRKAKKNPISGECSAGKKSEISLFISESVNGVGCLRLIYTLKCGNGTIPSS